MSAPTNTECNRIIDQLIMSRRSIRKFKQEAPPKELIEQILQAGLLAPYAGAGVEREDFRRFVVVPRESKATAQVVDILKRHLQAWSKQIEEQMQTNDFVKQHAGPFLGRLKMMAERGPPNVGVAPYYIVIAEQRGFPPAEQLALAHCLQNMWLKATALGLGMQLLSMTERLDKDEEFCDLLGVSVGEYALDGCLIGYPDMNPLPPKRPDLAHVTKWIS